MHDPSFQNSHSPGSRCLPGCCGSATVTSFYSCLQTVKAAASLVQAAFPRDLLPPHCLRDHRLRAPPRHTHNTQSSMLTPSLWTYTKHLKCHRTHFHLVLPHPWSSSLWPRVLPSCCSGALPDSFLPLTPHNSCHCPFQADPELTTSPHPHLPPPNHTPQQLSPNVPPLPSFRLFLSQQLKSFVRAKIRPCI